MFKPRALLPGSFQSSRRLPKVRLTLGSPELHPAEKSRGTPGAGPL
jgi:hypothetical protein